MTSVLLGGGCDYRVVATGLKNDNENESGAEPKTELHGVPPKRAAKKATMNAFSSLTARLGPGQVEPRPDLHLRFAVDVLRCARCGARREVLAVVMRPEPIGAILTYLDLVGPQGAPRPPPQLLSLI